MARIILLIIALVFAILLAVSIKYKKRIVAYGICGIIGIIGISWVLNHTIFYYNDDKVEVERLLGNYDNFNIKIKSHKLKFNGTCVTFSCKYTMNVLLEKVKEQYSNAYIDEKYNEIVIVYDNELFTISQTEHTYYNGYDPNYPWLKKHNYMLSSDTISYEEKIDNATLYYDYISIPFPVRTLKESAGIMKDDMLISCDFEDLKRYYKDFTNVVIEDGKIEITLKDYVCTMTPNGEYVHFEIEKK